MNRLNETILLNAGVAICVLGAAWYIIDDALRPETTPTCAARYGRTVEMTLEDSSGRPLSNLELTARLGLGSRNHLENAVVEVGGDAPARSVMTVSLAKGTTAVDGHNVLAGGVDFPWQPSTLNGAESACLSYDVRFADDFEFGMGGLLPGLYGGRPLGINEKSDGRTSFAARPTWHVRGTGAIYAQTPHAASSKGTFVGRDKFAFEAGRWTRVDQEIVLNTPGEANGVLRMWVDGTLVYELESVTWRDEASLAIEGVTAHVAFGGPDKIWSAPKSSAIALTPFRLAWQ